MIFKINKQVLAALFSVNNMKEGRYNIFMPKNFTTGEVLVAKVYYKENSNNPKINMHILVPTFKEEEIIFNIINDIFSVVAVPEIIYYFDFADHEYGNDITVFSIDKNDLDRKTEETLITTGNYFSNYDGYTLEGLKNDFNKHIINNLTNILNTFPKKEVKA